MNSLKLTKVQKWDVQVTNSSEEVKELAFCYPEKRVCHPSASWMTETVHIYDPCSHHCSVTGVPSTLMYVIRLTEFIFRFEIELHAILGHYYLWVLETSLPPQRAEVRSLRLAVTTEFSSGKGKEVINSNPEKPNACPEIATEPDWSLEEKSHRLEKEQGKKMGLLEEEF